MTTTLKPRYSTTVESMSPYEAAQRQALSAGLFLRLAWRNLWRHRRRTVIVVVAIGGTMALMMWYDGLVGGFNEAIYGNAIRVLGGNIQIHAAGYGAEVNQLPLLPLTNDEALVQAAQAQPQVMAATRRMRRSLGVMMPIISSLARAQAFFRSPCRTFRRWSGSSGSLSLTARFSASAIGKVIRS